LQLLLLDGLLLMRDLDSSDLPKRDISELSERDNSIEMSKRDNSSIRTETTTETTNTPLSPTDFAKRTIQGASSTAIDDLEIQPRPSKKNPRALSARFDAWYELYPVKKSKAAARQSWTKQNLDERADELMAILQRQVTQDAQWQRGYIPHPSTYLNQQRWEDEVTHEANRPVQQRSRHEHRAEISRYIDEQARRAIAEELGAGPVRANEGDLPAEMERPVFQR
jgi:hypothetical protein